MLHWGDLGFCTCNISSKKHLFEVYGCNAFGREGVMGTLHD